MDQDGKKTVERLVQTLAGMMMAAYAQKPPTPNPDEQRALQEIAESFANFEMTPELQAECDEYHSRLRIFIRGTIIRLRKGDLIAFAPLFDGFVNIEDNWIMEKELEAAKVTQDELNDWRAGYLTLSLEDRVKAEIEVDATWM